MERRLNIILDLDSTIIYGEEFKKVNNLDDIKEKYKNVHTMDTSYYIIERYGLQDFLTFLFKNFNVSVWTAASKNYALFIIQEVILKNDDRKLDWFFHSDHCEISSDISKSKEQKDLNILWETFKITNYNKDNTLIIDDNEFVFKTQPTNCIKVLPPFELKNKSYNDTFLEKLQKELTDEFLNNKQNTLEQSVKNINKLNELNK